MAYPKAARGHYGLDCHQGLPLAAHLHDVGDRLLLGRLRDQDRGPLAIGWRSQPIAELRLGKSRS
jgi:hypothetical protein